MGNGSYSSAIHSDTILRKRAAGKSVFVHHEKLKSSGKALVVHEKLDPSILNNAGQLIRESRDSVEHPNSVGIAVVFDVTGSMRKVPQIMIEKLPILPGFLIRNEVLKDPQVLFAAVGDAREGDRVPLQVGQFESGNEMDDALSMMVLEGGGGMSERKESYELAMYFLSEYAAMDCLEKRGKKGYLFFIGDELPRAEVSSKEVNKIIGDGLQGNLPTSQVLDNLQEKFEVFWITTGGTLHWNRQEIINPITEMFGQNYVRLEDPSLVCEKIAEIIANCEGVSSDKIAQGLAEVGGDNSPLAKIDKYKGVLVVDDEKIEGIVKL